MSESMLQFVSTPRRSPSLRAAEVRRQDFREIEETLTNPHASSQAARCSQCGVPMCQVHCPLHNNIPDWLKAVSEGRLQDAFALCSETNTFPEICGRICPQDRLCEGNCVIAPGFGAVTIGAVERYIAEYAWTAGWVQAPVAPHPRPQTVGIIGAGPAGLAAAERLCRLGYKVHVYDRYDRPGGLLIYGIPSFKLEKQVVLRRVQLLREAGVIFHMNFQVGRHASLDELRGRHPAMLIATGVYRERTMEVPGSDREGVVSALSYLTASNRVDLGDTDVADIDGKLSARGHDVVVIGGGDTAMDCVRTALRQQAKSVTCMYRRNRENMPGSPKEVKNAEAEGAQFLWLSAPKAYHGNQRVEKIEVIKMQMGFADEKGRLSPTPLEGRSSFVRASMVIHALGFDPQDLPQMFDTPDLKVGPRGTLEVDPQTFQTSLPDVFAAGDIVRGASLVVWAIHDGRKAAESLHRFMQSQSSKRDERHPLNMAEYG